MVKKKKGSEERSGTKRPAAWWGQRGSAREERRTGTRSLRRGRCAPRSGAAAGGTTTTPPPAGGGAQVARSTGCRGLRERPLPPPSPLPLRYRLAAHWRVQTPSLPAGRTPLPSHPLCVRIAQSGTARLRTLRTQSQAAAGAARGPAMASLRRVGRSAAAAAAAVAVATAAPPMGRPPRPATTRAADAPRRAASCTADAAARP